MSNERREEVKAKVEAAKAQLEQGLKAIQTSEDWKKMLQLLAQLGPTRISRLSFNNIILLQMQKPGIRMAATFNAWLKLKRPVQKGQKGLTILKPVFASVAPKDPSQEDTTRLVGFSPLTVFALEQTDGEPLPVVEPKDVVGPAHFEQTLETLKAFGKSLPEVSDIVIRPATTNDIPGVYGWFERNTKRTVVLTSPDRSPASFFTTLVHELAHALLHGNEDHHDIPTKELEAESVAFVVSHAMGLDTSCFSLPYVAGWNKDKDAAAQVSKLGDRIRKASQQLLSALLPETDAA